LDATVLAPGDKQKVSEAMDVGTSSRVEIQTRILKAGTAGNLTLEHAAVNEEGAYTALTGASWACNATSNTPTTITNFLRYIRWAAASSVAGLPVGLIDVVAKDR
jgi:hypothetical protein